MEAVRAVGLEVAHRHQLAPISHAARAAAVVDHDIRVARAVDRITRTGHEVSLRKQTARAVVHDNRTDHEVVQHGPIVLEAYHQSQAAAVLLLNQMLARKNERDRS